MTDRIRIIMPSFLLAVVLAGWVVAPVVHQVEHAVRPAAPVHHHTDGSGKGVQQGCDPAELHFEDCALCAKQVSAATEDGREQALPEPWDVRPGGETTAPTAHAAGLKGIRGPPEVA